MPYGMNIRIDYKYNAAHASWGTESRANPSSCASPSTRSRPQPFPLICQRHQILPQHPRPLALGQHQPAGAQRLTEQLPLRFARRPRGELCQSRAHRLRPSSSPSPRSDTHGLRSETTPPPSQPVRFDLKGYKGRVRGQPAPLRPGRRGARVGGPHRWMERLFRAGGGRLPAPGHRHQRRSRSGSRGHAARPQRRLLPRRTFQFQPPPLTSPRTALPQARSTGGRCAPAPYHTIIGAARADKAR